MAEYAPRMLIYDAIATCAADGEYSGGEKAVVRKAASILGVPEDVVMQLEAIYEEEKKLFQHKDAGCALQRKALLGRTL